MEQDTKGQSSSKGDAVYMVELEGNHKLPPENQITDSNKYWSQLDQLKAALNKKHLESASRKHNLPSG